ncbi:MAG: hypothetical protein IJ874_07925 [Ruminococcus sp.]|nr:hypothetical protein [Ruminococcus sp.]
MRIRPSREKRLLHIRTAIRWLLYYVLIFAGFIIMVSGSMLKPVILLPLALAIAVGNDLYASTVTAAVCGLLTDIACGRLFGFNAVLFSVFCIAVWLVHEHYLRACFTNYMWLTAVIALLQCRLDYVFYYGIWGYADAESIFLHLTLRVWLYTCISAVFVYLLTRLINKLRQREESRLITEN